MTIADALGRPGEGFHAHVLGVAALDVIGTVLVGWLVARWIRVPVWSVVAFLFCAGILMHRAFGVRTAVDRALFPHV